MQNYRLFRKVDFFCIQELQISGGIIECPHEILILFLLHREHIGGTEITEYTIYSSVKFCVFSVLSVTVLKKAFTYIFVL